MTAKPKVKPILPSSQLRSKPKIQQPTVLDTPEMTDEEREIYGRLICQYCGKPVSAALMEERRKAQSFPVCEPCMAEIIPLAEKMQAELGELMHNI